MNEFFYDKTAVILSAFLLGVIGGIIYDFFRIARIIRGGGRKPAFSVLTAFEDAAFTIISCTLLILFSYTFNNGEIRVYFILLAACGFVIYHISLGKIMITVMTAIINFSKRLIITVISVIMLPMKHMYAIIKSVTGRLRGKIVTHFDKRLIIKNSDRIKKELFVFFGEQVFEGINNSERKN